jgi:hypothetical protein
VVGVKEDSIEIFRPGYFTAKALKEILAQNGINIEVRYAQSPVAPGQLKHHYMPKIPLLIVPENFVWEKHQGEIEDALGSKFQNPVTWKQPLSPALASRELYQKMRDFDEEKFDIILAEKNSHHFTEEWLGIWNRLDKAKSLNYF